MAKKKRETRSSRLKEAMGIAENAKFVLDEILPELKDAIEVGVDDEQREKIANATRDALANVEDATGRVMELQEEMQSWVENMGGTNLANTRKYEDASAAAELLESAVGYFDNIEILDTADLRDMEVSDLVTFVEDAISELDSAIDECNGVEFPGGDRS